MKSTKRQRLVEAWRIAAPLLVAVGCQTGPDDAELRVSSASAHEATLVANLYQPDLGKGVNAAETVTFGQCVIFPEVVRKTAFSRRSYSEFSVQSRSELNDKMNVSAHMAARGLWGEAKASFSHFKTASIKDQSFYWVVDARYELAHESLATNSDSFQLTEKAKEHLRLGGYERFAAACGTQVYVGRTLGARYALLYEFASRSDGYAEKVQADARASAFGLSGDATFERAIDSAKQSNRLTVTVDVSGGDNTIAEKAESPQDLKEELAKLRQTLGEGKGAVLEWEALDYQFFPEVAAALARQKEALPDAETVNEALSFMYKRYIANSEVLLRVHLVLQKAETALPFYVFSESQFDAIQATRATFEAQNESISRRARSCLRYSTHDACRVDDIQALRETIPDPLADFSDTGTWTLRVSQAHFNSRFINMTGKKDHKLRHFITEAEIYSTSSGVMIATEAKDGTNWMVPIGDIDPVPSRCGALVPRICVQEYADVCRLRLVEDTSHLESDGGPRVKLVLSIFENDELQPRDYVFHSEL